MTDYDERLRKALEKLPPLRPRVVPVVDKDDRHLYAGCIGKRGYLNLGAALASRRALYRQNLDAYHCQFCKLWHLGGRHR